jgi:histidinol-phosphatase (PHP family)
VIDCHVHSRFSGDAHAGISDMCARAAELGLTEIVFTEHIDLDPHDEWANTAFDYKVWTEEIAAARESFAGRLLIRAGAEVDYQRRCRPTIERFLEDHRFDYVIGSVHYANGVILEDHKRYFPGKNARDAYAPYFEAAVSAAETGLFDALGHMDLCKRYGVLYYGPFAVDEFRSEVEEVLRAVIRQGMALEINTSGLRQAPKEAYPGVDALRLYKELGGTVVSIGSDSHKLEHLGMGLEEAMAMVEEVGLTQKSVL